MSGLPAERTSTTLMRRMRAGPYDPTNWREFIARYGRQIHGWCERYNLQPADADDVTQEVLLELARSMHKFQYDPSRSFRAWLKTLTHRAWIDFLDKRRRSQPASADSQVLAKLDQVEARDELEKRLAQEYDNELLDAAIFEVRRRVTPRTWDAFRLLAFEGMAGTDVAQRLNMKLGNVYVSRSNVQKLLKEELKRLEGS